MTEDEARWVRLERGEYAEDPETKILILHERWEAAQSDFYAQSRVARRAAGWLLQELRECVRLGRSCLLAAEALGGGAGSAYREQVGVYGWRVEECLRRAAAMASRSCKCLPMELGAAVPVAEATFSRVYSGPWDPEAIEQQVEMLSRAEAVLAGAFRVEGRGEDLGSFSGVVVESSAGSVESLQSSEPKPSSSSKSKEASAENRAMALATQWAKEGKELSVAKLAKEVGCSREYLHRRKGFMALLKALRGGPSSLPRGRKARDTRELEAWDEDD